jgi:glycine cleavage system H lipoate-binding protein
VERIDVEMRRGKGLTMRAVSLHYSEQIGAVESVKAASDIYSPVTGQIKSVNDKLGDEPGLLNKSPEENGE